MTKHYSKLKISPMLSLKIMKSPPRNPIHQELSNSTKSFLNFINLKKIYISIFCSILNKSFTIGLNITKDLDAHVFIKGFPMVPRAQWRVLWFGRSQCDKQNT
jgi:hypothetical protein